MVEQLMLLYKRENRASISKLIQERKALPVSAENEYGHNEKSFLRKEFDKYELAVEQELRKKYKRKSKESETDYENRIIMKLNSKRYNYIEKNYKNKKEKDIQDFAIKEGIMTEDECKIFNHYTKKRDAIIKKIGDFQDYAGNKIPGNRLEMLRGDIKQYLKIYIKDELIKSSGIDDYYKKNVRSQERLWRASARQGRPAYRRAAHQDRRDQDAGPQRQRHRGRQEDRRRHRSFDGRHHRRVALRF